jgi:hypothetical protein
MIKMAGSCALRQTVGRHALRVLYIVHQSQNERGIL